MKRFFDKVVARFNLQSDFIKAVSVLVSGAAFAQIIGILALPVLTRLYEPSEFSVFAVYTSCLAILSSVSCLRFEIAVPIPKDDNQAIALVLLALISNIFFCILVTLFIGFWGSEIIFFLKQPGFSGLIWYLPVGVFFLGLYNSLQFWFTRKKQFSLIAKTRVKQSLGGVFVQLAMGVYGFSVLGLILGQIVKMSSGGGRLAFEFYRETHKVLTSLTVSELEKTFKEYVQFPKYSTFDALASVASIQLPIIVISSVSSGSEVGYLMLAMQVLAVPITLIGGAISQVYLAQAAEAYEKGAIRIYTLEVLEKLFTYGFGALVFIGIVSPTVMGHIFGAKWDSVGIIITWLVPWFLLQFISSPISMVMHIANKQKTLLFITVCGLVIKTVAIYIQYRVNPLYIVHAYAISNAIFYLACYFLFTKTALLKSRDHVDLLKKSIKPTLLLIVLAMLLIFVLSKLGL